MNLNVVKQQCNALTLKCIRYHETLKNTKKNSILSQRLMESSIFLGLAVNNIQDTGHDLDRFIQEVTNSYNRARKVRFWIQLLKDSNQINEHHADSFIQKCEELLFNLISWKKLLEDNFEPLIHTHNYA